MKICADIFAERGEKWNARNPQHHASSGWRTVRQPDGTMDRVWAHDVDGYDVPTHGPHAAVRKPDWVDPPRPKLDPSARLAINARMARRRLAREIGNRP